MHSGGIIEQLFEIGGPTRDPADVDASLVVGDAAAATARVLGDAADALAGCVDVRADAIEPDHRTGGGRRTGFGTVEAATRCKLAI